MSGLPIFIFVGLLWASPVFAGLEPDLRASVPLKTVKVKQVSLGRSLKASEEVRAYPQAILRRSGEKRDPGSTPWISRSKVSRTFRGKVSWGGSRHPKNEPGPDAFAVRGRLEQAPSIGQDSSRLLFLQKALLVQDAPVARVQLNSAAEGALPAAVTLEELNRYVYRRDRPNQPGKPVPVTPAGGEQAD